VIAPPLSTRFHCKRNELVPQSNDPAGPGQPASPKFGDPVEKSPTRNAEGTCRPRREQEEDPEEKQHYCAEDQKDALDAFSLRGVEFHGVLLRRRSFVAESYMPPPYPLSWPRSNDL